MFFAYNLAGFFGLVGWSGHPWYARLCGLEWIKHFAFWHDGAAERHIQLDSLLGNLQGSDACLLLTAR